MAEQTLQPAATYRPPPVDSSGALLPAQSYSPPPQQGPQPAAPQAAPQQGQQGATQPPEEQGEFSKFIFGEGNTPGAILNDLRPSQIMNQLGHSPSEFVQNVKERAKGLVTGPLRGLATAEQRGMTAIQDATGTHMFDPGIERTGEFLSETAPKNPQQQESYTMGDQVAGMYITHLLESGLTTLQIAKRMKSISALGKLAEENPHIARVIGAGIKSGAANAGSTAVLGGGVGDIANAGMTGAAYGAFGEAPNALTDYKVSAAGKYKPDVTEIGGQKFTEVSKAARDKGITTQEQEPGLQEGNRQAYETLRDQSLRERAAQGTAATVNAMEPTQPPVSVAGAQRLKAKTAVSTAPPEKPITNATPRQIDQSKRFLQKVLDSKKFPQSVKDKAQLQMDRITTQEQAVTDWKNNPENFRTDTPQDPKVLMKNSTNFGEFAEELRRQAERRTQDMQWHERQYDANGNVKLDANGNEVWKPVDMKTMSRTEQDAAIADGDLAKKDVRNLSKVDVQQGQRMSRMAEAAQKLDEVTQKIYDLSRERAESVKTQTNQPDLRQEQRTANMQKHIDELEKLANGEYAPEFKDMFGRKDGITDLIAAAKKIGYADNGAKYSGTLGNYFLKTIRKRATLSGKNSLGVGLFLLAKSLGVPHTTAALVGETLAETAHTRFMHQIATNPEYANKVLTKDRTPRTPLRITASTLANLGTQVSVRNDVSKDVQSGGASSKLEGID